MYTAHINQVEKKVLPGRNVFVLSEKLQVNNLTVGICEVPSNSAMLPHKHKQEETIYIIKGYGKVDVDGFKEPINPGTLVFFPSNKEHLIMNESDEVMQFVFSFAPPVVVGSYG